MKRTFVPALALLCSLTMVLGCGSPEQKLIGTWQGQVVLSETAAQQPPADNPFAAAAQAAMRSGLENMLATVRPVYVFHADKTFTSSTQTPVGTVEANGTWDVLSHSGDTMTVRLHPNNDQPFEGELTFTDADHFQLQNEKGTLKFTRQTE